MQKSFLVKSGGHRRLLTHSEVGRSEGVGSVAVLADDGGGVALFAVVLAAATHAGHLADGGGEDHLDPPRLVANGGHWCPAQNHQNQGGKKREGEEEEFGHPG